MSKGIKWLTVNILQLSKFKEGKVVFLIAYKEQK